MLERASEAGRVLVIRVLGVSVVRELALLLGGLLLVPGGALADTPGSWQGQAYPPHTGSQRPPDRFLVLDTGGIGGGFGQGDIRQKLHDVSFWNEKLGWTCGYGGAFRTTDGGFTWTRMKPNGGWYHRDRMFFATSQRGWVASENGQCFFTADGGDTWQPRPLPTDQAVSALWFDQLGRGFAAVANQDFLHPREAVYETNDAGRTWLPVLGGRKHVSTFSGLGTGRLWAVGDVPGFVPNDLVLMRRRNVGAPAEWEP